MRAVADDTRSSPDGSASGVDSRPGSPSPALLAGLTALLTAFLVTAASPPAPAAIQAPPATDIWILPVVDGVTDAEGLTRVTDRPAYDNQPAFEEGGTLLYTADLDGQTDIMRYDPGSDTRTRLTRTPESEYSPTRMPWSGEISVVRVESDGSQRLWAFPGDGGEPRLLLPGVEPVGYHAWLPDASLALFVLGEPPTLQVADLADGTAMLVAEGIGRSLEPMPDHERVSFLQRASDQDRWSIRALDPESVTIAELGAALEGSQDLAWMPDGRMLMARGTEIFARRPEESDWSSIVDLADGGLASITRIAVSADGSRLALVATAEATSTR